MICLAQNLMATGFAVAAVLAIVLTCLVPFCCDIFDRIIGKVLLGIFWFGAALMPIGLLLWAMAKIWIC